MSKVTKRFRVIHEVEYVIDAEAEPGMDARLTATGWAHASVPKAAEVVANEVIERMRVTPFPTSILSLTGGHYHMRVRKSDVRVEGIDE